MGIWATGGTIWSLQRVIAAALLVGPLVRLAFRDHTTSDVVYILLPWYEQARQGGVDSMGDGLTNYAPLYSYLLLLATELDGLAPPLYLIKAISFVFEMGSAIIAYRLILTITGSSTRAALCFAACWLAPSVIYNGALWAQADSIWTFFVLLSVFCIVNQRYQFAMLAFAVAVSVKLQAVFLGPLIFALILKRSLHWGWLALIPVVYLVLAIPTLAAGRPLMDVLFIYANQAEFFQSLSMGAPNLWAFIPNDYYTIGVIVGVTLGAVCGLAFSIIAARSNLSPPVNVILAATITLGLMPWILPKMHDRYFYSFELMLILLAFVVPRLTLAAVVIQVAAVLTYANYDLGFHAGLPYAVILYTTTIAFLIAYAAEGKFNVELYAKGAGVMVAGYGLGRAVEAITAG